MRYSAAAGLDEDVFLHPNSTLHSTAPEFVVYAELIRTAKRPYMAGKGWTSSSPWVALPLLLLRPLDRSRNAGCVVVAGMRLDGVEGWDIGRRCPAFA